MLKDKAIKIKELESKLQQIEIDKKETMEMLAEKRRKLEEVYLQPVLKREKEARGQLDYLQKAYVTMLCDEFDVFTGTEGGVDAKAKQLLEGFKSIRHYEGKELKQMLEKSQVLFDYFIAKEDIDSASDYLRYRAGSIFRQDEYDQLRTRYQLTIVGYDEAPKYSDSEKYILGYGEYIQDIVKLIEVCGVLDARCVTTDQGIYYSQKSKDLIVSGAIGEFGQMEKHLYAGEEFGHEDKDRATLMYWHDKGYASEKMLIQGQTKEMQ